MSRKRCIELMAETLEKAIEDIKRIQTARAGQT